MVLSARMRWTLRILTCVGLLFLYIPLALVVVNAFNSSRTFAFPPDGFTLKWWHLAADSSGAKHALWTSVQAGLGATAIALVLGTMAAFAVQRYKFFGRSTVSFLVILPIALPGIVTGIALRSSLDQVVGVHNFGLKTVIIGHATFCVVIVFNNVQARLRRTGSSLEEASRDLGATGWQTFRLVTFPGLRGALLAGALLAFGLSFDEIVVTNFTSGAATQTLPLWIYGNLTRPNQAPVVNVVAAVLIVLAVVPVWLAQRIGDGAEQSRF
ncbi:MAG: putative spermidine/putrescine transport system permease protein [Pseudonocardiales bacterium]|jgi:putative spermidine/putrescine transport system permease protein|nr:putative spermidine/putrescine transport system permease protein [Pseudonocardiales bacterium]